MQFHVPDPACTGSEQARAHFRLAVKIAFGFLALISLIYLVQSAGKAKKTNPDGQEFLLGGSHQTIKQTD